MLISKAPYPSDYNPTLKLQINAGIQYEILHLGPSSDTVINIHHGQSGGIHSPVYVYVLRSLSSTMGATGDTNYIVSTV